jgi:Methyltransferase domain
MMNDADLAQPGVMPLDREAWKNELNLSNFINTYYQFRDVKACVGDNGKILIVGPGAGLDAVILRWRQFNVTTFDIDETFSPDVQGSCHDMPMFEDKEFDVVIASHVLEHLPRPFLEPALAELARVAKFAIIYLPVAGKHAQIRVHPKILGRPIDMIVDFFKFWERPTGVELKYTEYQHYWEVGYRGYRLKEVRVLFEKNFTEIAVYRNRDWIPSHNFVLKSR